MSWTASPSTRKAISIHALREEGDCLVIVGGFGVLQFLSTPSARRATLGLFDGLFPRREFLSTPSARRATINFQLPRIPRSISIHALREEGDGVNKLLGGNMSISIHALREEGDLYRLLVCLSQTF